MIVYIYSKCSTCQKALRFLEKKWCRDALIIKEITQEPPSKDELQQMLQYQGGNVKKLFNTSGQLYRELKLQEKLKSMSLEEAFDLLTKHGMLVKRPFLLGRDGGCTGFIQSEWEKMCDAEV